MRSDNHGLSGNLLTRNFLWNIFGISLPLVVAIWAIPKLINGFGVDRFGLLSIIWMGVGYFSLFDMGVGRALTKLLAEKLGNEKDDEIPILIKTALTLMAVLGISASVLLYLFSPWLVKSALEVPFKLQAETIFSFRILALSIPIVIVTTGLIAIFQAYQDFGKINIVRIPLGLTTFLGPVAALTFSSSLILTTFILLLARFLALAAFFLMLNSSLKKSICIIDKKIDKNYISQLLTFGGWMTVSNIIGPLMVYFDRFFIASYLGVAAVAYYVTPYEVIVRLWIVPEALVTVLFPAVSRLLYINKNAVEQIINRALQFLLCVMPIPIILVVLFGKEALGYWVGTDISVRAGDVVIILAFGVFINSFARIPYASIQAKGHPNLTAKLHLLELPLYLILLWFFAQIYGLEGVAYAWVLRIAFDAILLFALDIQLSERMKLIYLKSAFIILLQIVAMIYFMQLTDFYLKIAIVSACILSSIFSVFLVIKKVSALDLQTYG